MSSPIQETESAQTEAIALQASTPGDYTPAALNGI